jgi:membrane protein DedA with SNARE-associated domain
MPRSMGLLVLAIHLHLHIRLHHGVPPASIDYAALALASFASWAGLPGPGEPLLIAAAIVASKHNLDIKPVLAWAFVGASVGGIAGWLAGLFAGRAVMTAPGPLLKLRLRAVERGEEVFERWTITAIILTPAWVAGIHRVSTWTYLIVNEVTAVVWAVGIGLGAYYAGPPVLDIVADAGWLSAVGIALLIAAGIGLEVIRRRRRSREAA